MAKLTADERKRIPKKMFGIPEKAPGSGSYPMEDETHARDALARSSGKPAAKRVRAKARELYPGMRLNPARLHSLSSLSA
jgi:hypothetical protein